VDQKSLTEKILHASQEIHKASLRGSGHYVVVSPESGDIFTAAYRISKIKRIFNVE
jgi:hypothetical protein